MIRPIERASMGPHAPIPGPCRASLGSLRPDFTLQARRNVPGERASGAGYYNGSVAGTVGHDTGHDFAGVIRHTLFKFKSYLLCKSKSYLKRLPKRVWRNW